MDIDLLKTFLEVNRMRHFGKAADNLFITQSTVSARIRQLEETVGTPLFTRDRNDIQLTTAGQRLVPYAEKINTTWNRAHQEIAAGAYDRIQLTIAGVPSLWDTILQDWLLTLPGQFPRTSLIIESLPTELITRRLQNGTLDMAFMFDPPQLSTLTIREVIKMPLLMVSSQAGTTVQHAIKENYILVDWGASFAETHAHLFPELPSPQLRMGMGRVARDYILHQGGTAYLAEPMVSDLLDRGMLHQVENAPLITKPGYVAYPVDHDQAGLIHQLLHYFEL